MDAVKRRLGELSGRDERREYGWPAAVVERATPPFVIPDSTQDAELQGVTLVALDPGFRQDDGEWVGARRGSA